MKKISIFLILFFSKLQAVEHSNNFVLECFALDDLKHDIRYYSVINYNLYYNIESQMNSATDFINVLPTRTLRTNSLHVYIAFPKLNG